MVANNYISKTKIHAVNNSCPNFCDVMVHVCHGGMNLTHWGRVMHIPVSKLTIISSECGLSPDRRQAIIWTNAGILLSGPLGRNFSEILIEIHIFSFKKMHLKMSSGKWRPFYIGFNVLSQTVLKLQRSSWLKCIWDFLQPLTVQHQWVCNSSCEEWFLRNGTVPISLYESKLNSSGNGG